MGIPSYFSQIIKKYPMIVRNMKHHRDQTQFHNLYMDCNSIIYDAVHSFDSKPPADIEPAIIALVIQNIEKYIQNIQPSHTVIIAFDGVAPFAKMNQQKTRRYKSAFMAELKPVANEWSTSNITPGTKFMNMLSESVGSYFKHAEQKYGIQQMIVSGSDENGEGEHKIFKHIREKPNIEQNTMIYGLDSDLIMLTIFHTHLFKNGYIFREAPEFMKSSIDVDISSKDPYVLDIGMLSECIQKNFDCKYRDRRRIYDYVFMCFLLGNDFLPHFPGLNIRTHGIGTLMDTYVNVLGKYPDRFFIKDGVIQWRYFAMFIKEIAKNEHQFILNEYSVRDKNDKRVWKTKTDEDRETAMLNLPVIYRGDEKYIYPNEKMWEERYYTVLFHQTRSPESVKSICTNYLEGIEWVFKYYSGDCPDWRWSYNYHYPPLFADLQHYIPDFGITFITKFRPAFSSKVQLAYVLPSAQFYLLSTKTRDYIDKKCAHLYANNVEFKWAFCRYFWEAHVCFPPISVETLKQWERDI
jgi:5'-3' exonuclease